MDMGRLCVSKLLRSLPIVLVRVGCGLQSTLDPLCSNLGRPSVKPNVASYPRSFARLNHLFLAVVARRAETLKWTRPKLRFVALVRLDVIANRGQNNLATAAAEHA